MGPEIEKRERTAFLEQAKDTKPDLPNLRGFGRTQAKPGASARGCRSRVSQVTTGNIQNSQPLNHSFTLDMLA